MSRRRRQRDKIRRSRPPPWKGGDAESPNLRGQGPILDWSAPSRGMLRSLAMALRRGWVEPERFDALVAGVWASLESDDVRYVLAAARVILAADIAEEQAMAASISGAVRTLE